MKSAPIPDDESQRLADLQALNILDTPREPRFDHLTELVADVFEMPMVFLTMIDADRQWYKSTWGIDVDSTPRNVGFCAHAIVEREPMVVPNATKDFRFADNPFVTGDFHLRFYAGVPLHGRNGKAIGALGLVDREPREFSPKQVERLKKFATLVENQIQG